MEKKKWVSTNSSAHGILDGEKAKLALKHQSLLQDYFELKEETEIIKKRLQKAKRKKLTLLAEVRFLRHRYEYLAKDPPRESSSQPSIHLQSNMIRREPVVKERKRNYIDEAVGRPHKLLDLNQASVPVALDSSRVDKKMKSCSTSEEPPLGSDLTLSIWKQPRKRSSHPVKRRVSWQDPVALKV